MKDHGNSYQKHPQKWQQCTLGEVSSVESGYAFKSKWFISKGTKVARISDIKENLVDLSDAVHINEDEHPIQDRFRALEGDILMALSGATTGKIGLVGLDAHGVLVNQRIAIIRGNENGWIPYIKYVLLDHSFIDGLIKKASGSAQANLSPNDLRNAKIPLPPLSEQKRIAAILDKADAIRKKRKKAIELTETFLRSAFLEMFGDPVTNPKGWEVIQIGDVLTEIEGGWSVKGDERPLMPGEMGVLKISAVTSGRFDPNEFKAVPIEYINKKVIIPRKGDVLFSRANTRELVAATCIVESDHKNIFLPDKLWRLIPQRKRITGEYLKYVLSHDIFRRRLTRHATGTSGSMLNISKGKLRNTKLPLPPIKLQESFSGIVWNMFETKGHLKESAQESFGLFNSLVQYAFRGEL